MASTYDRFLYTYSTDLGKNKPKAYRAYYVKEGGNKRYTSPVTNLFLARVITANAKVAGNSNQTRRLIAFVNEQNTLIQRTVHLPYPPLDETLFLHIKEILSVDNVECGDYLGENPLEK